MTRKTDPIPLLKITVEVTETGDVLETLYTEASWFDIREVLREHAVVFDSEAEYETSVCEENDRG